MTASPEPGSHPTVDATQARDLLAQATAVTPGTARDRHRHALALLGGGAVMAAVASFGALIGGRPWSILWTLGSWAVAVVVILRIGTAVERRSRSTPRGMARASSVASWAGFGVLVAGRPVLDLVSSGTPSAVGTVAFGVAVLVPFALAAHRIWWDAWIPGASR